MEDPASPRSQAEQAFHRYLDLVLKGRAPDSGAFLAGQPEELRPDLERLLKDYDELRRGLADGGDAGGEARELGDFRLLRPLGRGGTGTVWEAEQVSLGRKVALKLLAPHFSLSDTWLQRFRREAEAGGRLSHSGIVAIHAIGQEEGTHFIAQELVPGGRSLADRIEEASRQKNLSEAYYLKTGELFAEVADALASAHAGGVIHRDVKPGNILLAGDDRPKVADFGLAQVQEELTLSRTGEVAGTPYYMSPEQVAGKRIGLDARTDVFSLGATLYEALCFARPFEGDTGQQVIEKILLEDPPDPRRLRSKVPRELALICLKALEKRRERRYQSMAELGADLRRYLANQPVLARPTGPVTRAFKWTRRHPVVTVSSSVALVAVAVVGWLVAENRASAIREHQSAETAAKVADFMVKIFEEADPRQARGDSVSAREALEQGVELVRTELADSPEIQATMMDALGWSLLWLGKVPEAHSLLAEALELRTGLLGPEDPATLVTRHRVAESLVRQGRFREAEAMHREVLAARQRVLGPDEHATMESKVSLGWCLFRAGRNRWDEAEALQREAQEDHMRAFGPEEPETLANWVHLAVIHSARGRASQAEECFQKAMRGAALLYGPDHIHTLVTRANYARFLSRNDRPEEAIRILEEVREVFRDAYGEGHVETLQLAGHLARVHQDHDQLPEAEALLLEIHEVRARTQGSDHPATLAAAMEVARLYKEWGRDEDGLEWFRKAMDGRLVRLGPEDPETLQAMEETAWAYRRMDRHQEAANLLEQVWNIRQRTLGPEDARTLATEFEVGEVWWSKGEPGLAEPYWRRALEVRRRVLPAGHRDLLENLEMLAELLLRTGRAAKALPLAREALEQTPANASRLEQRQGLVDRIEAAVEAATSSGSGG